MAVRDYCWESVIHGHHVYKTIWTPEIAEILHCEQETGNTEDSYAVSIVKGDTIVGHVPHEKSRIVWYFIEHNGIVNCEVTARRKHGKGLEVPCIYCFTGKKKNVNKLQKLLAPAEHKS